MSVPGDILKPADVISEHCPYKPMLNASEDPATLEFLVDYATKVERGETSCGHTFDGTCGVAKFALERQITTQQITEG